MEIKVGYTGWLNKYLMDDWLPIVITPERPGWYCGDWTNEIAPEQGLLDMYNRKLCDGVHLEKKYLHQLEFTNWIKFYSKMKNRKHPKHKGILLCCDCIPEDDSSYAVILSRYLEVELWKYEERRNDNVSFRIPIQQHRQID